MKIYVWRCKHIDGKVNEQIVCSAEPGCCKQ